VTAGRGTGAAAGRTRQSSITNDRPLSQHDAPPVSRDSRNRHRRTVSGVEIGTVSRPVPNPAILLAIGASSPPTRGRAWAIQCPLRSIARAVRGFEKPNGITLPPQGHPRRYGKARDGVCLWDPRAGRPPFVIKARAAFKAPVSSRPWPSPTAPNASMLERDRGGKAHLPFAAVRGSSLRDHPSEPG